MAQLLGKGNKENHRLKVCPYVALYSNSVNSQSSSSVPLKGELMNSFFC